MLHDVADALTFGGFQLVLQIGENLLQMGYTLLCLGNILVFFGKVGIQTLQHIGGICPDKPDVFLQQFVQFVHADMMTATRLQPSPVIQTAAVGIFDVRTAHSEHGISAVPAFEEP